MEQAAGEDVTRLVEELGTTIRRVLSESTQITHALNRIRAEGYGVSVALEATIGFGRIGRREGPEAPATFEVRVERADPASLKMTPLDKKFLRSLKITVEEEE